MEEQWKKDLVRRVYWLGADGSVRVDVVECQFDRGRIYYDVAKLAKQAEPGDKFALGPDGISYDSQHAAAERIAGHPIAWPAEHPDMRESN